MLTMAQSAIILASGFSSLTTQIRKAHNMKALPLLLLLALAAIPVFAADAPSMTGKWKVHNSIVGNESDQDCTFTQKDNDITGTCSLEQGSADVTGKITDASVTWQYKTEYNGTPLTLVYTGTADKDSKIVGSVEVQPMSVTGDFTATPSK